MPAFLGGFKTSQAPVGIVQLRGKTCKFHSVKKLTTNMDHGAGGGHEIRLADVVALLFVCNGVANTVGNVGIGSAIYKKIREIVLPHAEETGSDLAVAGYADAGTGAAKG